MKNINIASCHTLTSQRRVYQRTRLTEGFEQHQKRDYNGDKPSTRAFQLWRRRITTKYPLIMTLRGGRPRDKSSTLGSRPLLPSDRVQSVPPDFPRRSMSLRSSIRSGIRSIEIYRTHSNAHSIYKSRENFRSSKPNQHRASVDLLRVSLDLPGSPSESSTLDPIDSPIFDLNYSSTLNSTRFPVLNSIHTPSLDLIGIPPLDSTFGWIFKQLSFPLCGLGDSSPDSRSAVSSFAEPSQEPPQQGCVFYSFFNVFKCHQKAQTTASTAPNEEPPLELALRESHVGGSTG
ncbi:hypothetical protein F4680DRAFT_403067 [Xylaria scruposa]|nr:hypothetical protein F4680DRAFT_403067 [Xylaria scruposa]